MSDFSQEDFNLKHVEPAEYGEGDYCVVGDQYTEEQARKKISDFVTMLTGEPVTNYYDIDGLGKIGIGIGTNEDGEPDYVVNPKNGAPYQGWGVSQL